MGSRANDSNLVYGHPNDGKLRALSATDGHLLSAWNFDTITRSSDAHVVSSPALAAGCLYAASTNGFVVCLQEDAAR